MTKKIFVTGGNGFIGSRLVHHLLKNGYDVKCLLRKTSKTDRIDGLNYERYEGDITDFENLVEGMKDCDGVMHLASLSNWDDIHSDKMRTVVIEGSKNVINAAIENNNMNMVYVSSSTAIDGTDEAKILDENSSLTLDTKIYSYAWAKKEVEGFCAEADQITSGNLIDFATSKPAMVCHGGTSIVHVDDVAAGIVAAFEKGKAGERYFLGSDNLTFKEIARLTLDLLDRKQKIITLPNGLISFIAKLGAKFKIPLPFNPAVIPYAVKYWFVSNEKAKRELEIDFRPAPEILKPTVDWLAKENLV
jgi:dihydroflavonol-4-reductase